MLDKVQSEWYRENEKRRNSRWFRFEGDTRALRSRDRWKKDGKISFSWSLRHSFGYPWLPGYRYHAASLLVPALREQERVLSLLLGSLRRKVATACDRSVASSPMCPARAVYSWKWSRYATKREGIVLLADEKEASNVSSSELSSLPCSFLPTPQEADNGR